MDAETRALRDSCDRSLHGDGPQTSSALLASIPAAVELDTYGDGGVVADLEAHVAALLGKPAAVYLPSGTMAQSATLRVHADARSSRTVLWHPTCHLELYEMQAHARLHALLGRPVGHPDRLITLDDLQAVAEAPAALLLELPQREIGGRLPEWEQLTAQVAWARDRGAAAHLDGARLWEASAGYGCPPSHIAELFDTVYVSFYKGIGALPGCCVAGPEHVVEQVREWRRRLGGTLYGLWPGAASALALLDERLGEMPARLEHARSIAAALAGIDGATVLPDPPQVPMMHLLLTVDEAAFETNARQVSTERGIWVPPRCAPTADPGVVRVELTVGRATLALTADEVADVVTALVRPAAREAPR